MFVHRSKCMTQNGRFYCALEPENRVELPKGPSGSAPAGLTQRIDSQGRAVIARGAQMGQGLRHCTVQFDRPYLRL